MANNANVYRGTLDLKQAVEGVSDLATLQTRLQEIVSNLHWVHRGGGRLAEPISDGVVVVEADECACHVPGMHDGEHMRARALRSLGLRSATS
jgi:hypothetical protein